MSSEPVVWSAEQKAFPFMNDIPAQPGSLPSLANALRTVPEHRKPRGYQKDDPPYPLVPMLLLLLVAVLCGRRGYESIAEWAEMCATEHPALLDALGCPRDRRRRTPVAATFFRCVRDICLRPFQEAMQTWLGETIAALHLTQPSAETAVPDDQITIDGKTIRGAAGRRERDAGDPTVGLHLFAAYVPALHIVLDQLTADNKGQELTMAKLLLGQLPLQDRVITGDALLTQRDICTTIMDGGGQYLFPVKENQPALLHDIEEAFSPSGSTTCGRTDHTGRAADASSTPESA